MFPVLLTIENFDLRASYVFLALGILAGLVVGFKENKRVGFETKNFHLYWMSAVPFALLIGALNGFLFRFRITDALARIDESLSYGLVSFGAIGGMLLLGYVVATVRKQNVGLTLDTIALILPLILGIYRIGCMLNGCCYGLETDSFLGIVLPNDFGVWARRYPTQIWLMVFNLGLFAWLWSQREKKAFNGMLTIQYLVIYSAGRFIEK